MVVRESQLKMTIHHYSVCLFVHILIEFVWKCCFLCYFCSLLASLLQKFYVQFVDTGEYLLRNLVDALTVNDLSVIISFLVCSIYLSNTHTQRFYSSLDFVWDNPREPVPEDTFTHSHLLWSSFIPYLLPLSIIST